jgi:hypothetical protein
MNAPHLGFSDAWNDLCREDPSAVLIAVQPRPSRRLFFRVRPSGRKKCLAKIDPLCWTLYAIVSFETLSSSDVRTQDDNEPTSLMMATCNNADDFKCHFLYVEHSKNVINLRSNEIPSMFIQNIFFHFFDTIVWRPADLRKNHGLNYYHSNNAFSKRLLMKHSEISKQP